MITKRNNPITGAQPQYSRKRPLVPDAKDTSADAQIMIEEAPSPFKNRLQVPQIPASTNPNYRANSQFQKDALRYGGTGRASTVREMRDPDFGAVGYERGATKPKSGNSVISGYPTRGNGRVAGDGNQRVAKGIKVKRFRTNTDIFSPRVLHELGLSKL